MSDMSAEIGLASTSAGVAAAEGGSPVVGDERPGDRLDQAAGGERPLGPAGAGLDEGEDRLRARRGCAASGAGGTRSTPMMRTTSSTRSALMVVAGRQLGTVTDSVPSVRCGFTTKPSAVEDAAHLGHRRVDAAEALDLGHREIDDVDRVAAPRRRGRPRSACRRRGP